MPDLFMRKPFLSTVALDLDACEYEKDFVNALVEVITLINLHPRA